MNTKHRTIVVLLALVAVLLGLNLLPKADAGENGPAPAPYIVELLPRGMLFHNRIWSDGHTDQVQVEPGCVPIVTPLYGPVEHPFAVVDAIFAVDNSAIMMTFEDGRVDLVGDGIRCTITGIGSPSFCTGDVDRDGIVGIEDFLIVLGQWDCQ